MVTWSPPPSQQEPRPSTLTPPGGGGGGGGGGWFGGAFAPSLCSCSGSPLPASQPIGLQLALTSAAQRSAEQAAVVWPRRLGGGLLEALCGCLAVSEASPALSAGSRAMDYSHGLFGCQSPSSPFLGGLRVLHLLEDLRGALELMDDQERDNLRCQIPDSTAEGLAQWLHGRLVRVLGGA